jgi:histidine triad (HIT) family protein
MDINIFSNAPKDYKCPICLGVSGIESLDTFLKKDDLIFRDDLVSVYINSFWIKTAEGHVIVVPNKHFENIYEIEEGYLHRIMDTAKKVAVAMKKAYRCDGITIRQNNEPASMQHAFHFHLHVFPRYIGDKFEENLKDKFLSDPEKRLEFKQKLLEFLK